MTTHLVMLEPGEIEALRMDSDAVLQAAKLDEERFSTRIASALNLFLTGTPFPEAAEPLAAALLGSEAVQPANRPDTSFGVVPARTVPAIAKALRRVDRSKVRARVRRIDLEALVDQGVDGGALLAEALDPAEDVLEELESLTGFYEAAASRRSAVLAFSV